MAANPSPLTVTRTVDLPAPIDAAWTAITDPSALSEWLDGPVTIDIAEGATGHASLPDGDRSILVTSVRVEEELTWMWWSEGGEVSSVSLALAPLEEGVRLTVIERLVAPASVSAHSRWDCLALARV